MPDLGEVWLGAYEGSTDDDVHAQTAEALHAWIVRGDLTPHFASGESGYDVVRRMSAALEQIASISTRGSASLVVGHVASLTAAISHLCRNGATLWGQPLPRNSVPGDSHRHDLVVPLAMTIDGRGIVQRSHTEGGKIGRPVRGRRERAVPQRGMALAQQVSA